MAETLTDELIAAREAILHRHLEAERSTDPAAILATFAHPRYELVGNGRVFDGEQEVRRYLDDRARIFPDLATDVIHFWHSPDVVAAELWLSGTHMSGFNDVTAPGRKFRVRTACFFEFEGSGLVGVRAYYDAGTIARQLA
jgi:steroid delta-isomerase-like uncharacterized protein